MSSTFQLSPDKRSVKTDFFSITLDDQQQHFKINITHPELVVSLDFDRVDRGFKVGEGKTYLGNNNAGFVSHKFWPRAHAKGTFIVNKAVHEIEGDGMFIHAIQGMQPHLIASHWNFVNFHSDRVSLGTMRFQTTKQYGAAHVNQGSLMLDGRLLMVSVENGVELLDLVKDDETDYDIPKKVKLSWKGKTIEDNKEVSVVMTVKVKNLVDKIDVLTEIPYVIRKLMQTFVVKPYIYQWLDKATAEIKIGDDPVILSEGYCFQELVFVSSF
ncbi:MAG: oxidative stress survival, Svf1-like protein [Benjaminiella poitrasii]|nr:MAG: oxidative stress survival, Svf1-like protein [Benjaminiella poitrasii]